MSQHTAKRGCDARSFEKLDYYGIKFPRIESDKEGHLWACARDMGTFEGPIDGEVRNGIYVKGEEKQKLYIPEDKI